jgi:transposase InsO family protein
MTITMNDDGILDVGQLQGIVKQGSVVRFSGKGRAEMYAWIESTLTRFRYFTESKENKGIVRSYLIMMSGLRGSRIDKLIRRKKETGKVLVAKRTQHAFPAKYTTDDVALLALVMKAHNYPNGKAAVAGMKDMYDHYEDQRFIRLKDLSVSHLYNLKGRRQYQTATLDHERTRPVSVPIGERRKPRPDGRPGFIRVDSVHQGDLDKEKGVYHVNLVDETEQWEIVVCVEGISEYFLLPALEAALASFPFRILNFHSDNGSEYINKTVAYLLNKLLIEQTKSRSRRTNDNALVEGKNGAIIRKWMGHAHIPKKHAKAINAFYQKFFNPYLNFHRHCAYPTDYVDQKGKVRKKYETYLTPCQKLLRVPHVEQYLKPGVTKESLEKESMRLTHLAAAQEVQDEKYKLFKAMV